MNSSTVTNSSWDDAMAVSSVESSSSETGSVMIGSSCSENEGCTSPYFTIKLVWPPCRKKRYNPSQDTDTDAPGMFWQRRD